MSKLFQNNGIKSKLALFLSLVLTLSCLNFGNVSVSAQELESIEVVADNSTDELTIGTQVTDEVVSVANENQENSEVVSETEQTVTEVETVEKNDDLVEIKTSFIEAVTRAAALAIFDEDYTTMTSAPSWSGGSIAEKDEASSTYTATRHLVIPSTTGVSPKLDASSTGVQLVTDAALAGTGKTKYGNFIFEFSNGSSKYISVLLKNNLENSAQAKDIYLFAAKDSLTVLGSANGSLASSSALANTNKFYNLDVKVTREDDANVRIIINVDEKEVINTTTALPSDYKFKDIHFATNQAVTPLRLANLKVYDLDTMVDAPDTPSGTITAESTKGDVKVDWVVASDSKATGYKLVVSENGSTVKSYNVSGASTTTYTIPGNDLANGKTYKIELFATNVGGSSEGSISKDYTLSLAAPSNVNATSVSGAVKVTWDALADATGYNVYLNGTKVNADALTTTQYVHESYDTATTLNFTVKAVNNAGEGTASAVVSEKPGALTEKPATPVLTVSAGDQKAILSWVAVPTASTYTIYKDGTKLADVTTGVTYTATGLTNGTEYTFELSATNTVGESAKSTAVKATPFKPNFNVRGNGWIETAYANWEAYTGATGYNVYYKKTADADTTYKKIDEELVRVDTVNGGYRADVLGLPGEISYTIKVVPTDASGEMDASSTVVVTPRSHDRTGFAFSPNSPYKETTGGYEADGTVADTTDIIYVTNDNIHTVQYVGPSGTTYTGLNNIFYPGKIGANNDNKSTGKKLIIRFIGKIEKPLLYNNTEFSLDIKDTHNITLEGVGEDAGIYGGWGFVSNRSSNVVIRNLGFGSFAEDAVGVKGPSDNNWIVNNTFHIGIPGGDSDKAKGDGSTDIKFAATYYTVSYNHYVESGKSCLAGMNTQDYYGTYHHNWFDRSGSRHPRVRGGSIHVYNNYFLGNTTYGVGASEGSSILVQNNTFEGVKYPMIISMQGHSLKDAFFNENSTPFGGTDQKDDIMSKEGYGAIRQEGNTMDAKSKEGFSERWDQGDAYNAVPGSGFGEYRPDALAGFYSQYTGSKTRPYEDTMETAEQSKNTVVKWAGTQTFVDPLAPPAQVTGLQASINDDENYVLTWDSNPSATSYVIYASDSADGNYTVYANVNGMASSFTSTEKAVASSTKYFKVSGINGNGEGFKSNAASISYVAPEAPTGLTLTAFGSMLDAAWTAPSGVSSFEVTVTSPNGYSSKEVVASKSYSLEGLDEGTYTVSVKSIKGSLSSSSAATATANIVTTIKFDDIKKVLVNEDYAGQTSGTDVNDVISAGLSWILGTAQSDTGAGSEHNAKFKTVAKGTNTDNIAAQITDLEEVGETTNGKSVALTKTLPTATTAERVVVSFDYTANDTKVQSTAKYMKLVGNDGTTIVDDTIAGSFVTNKWVTTKYVLNFTTKTYDKYVYDESGTLLSTISKTSNPFAQVPTTVGEVTTYSDPTATGLEKMVTTSPGKNSKDPNGSRNVATDNYYVAEVGADNLLAAPTNLAIATGTLTFDAVSGATGYKVYYGASEDALTKAIYAPTNTVDVSGLISGTTYFKVAPLQGEVIGNLSSTISGTGVVSPTVTGISQDGSLTLPATGGTRTRVITVTGTNLTATNVTLNGVAPNSVSTDKTTATFNVTVEENTTTTAKSVKYTVELSGTATDKVITFNVSAAVDTTPTVTGISQNGSLALPATGGDRARTITVTGTNLTSTNVKLNDITPTNVAGGTTATFNVTVAENTTTAEMPVVYTAKLNGTATNKSITFTVSGLDDSTPVDPAEPTVTRISPSGTQTVVATGGTQTVKVTGTNLTRTNVTLNGAYPTTVNAAKTEATFSVSLDENTSIDETKSYEYKVSLNGTQTNLSVTFVVSKADAPSIKNVVVSPRSINYRGGKVQFTVTGNGLSRELVKVYDENGSEITPSKTGATNMIFQANVAENNTEEAVTHNFKVMFDGVQYGNDYVVTVYGKPVSNNDNTSSNGNGNSINKKPITSTGSEGSTTTPTTENKPNENKSGVSDAKLASDTKAVESAISESKAEGKTEVTVKPSEGETSLAISQDTVKAMTQNKLDLKVETGTVSLVIPSTELERANGMDVVVDIAAAQIASEEIVNKFDKVDAKNAELFKSAVSDITLKVNDKKVVSFETPLTVTFDLSAQNLTDDQIANLSAVRVLDQATGKVDYLGGSYDKATGIYTTQTPQLSQYGVVIADPNEVTRIYTQIGNDKFVVDGKTLTIDVAPQIINGKTYVPVRFIAEALNATVEYDNATKFAYIKLADQVITLKQDQEIEGTEYKPLNVDGRNLVPLRSISELFGANVIWHSTDKSIDITK